MEKKEILGLTVQQVIDELSKMPKDSEVILQGRYYDKPLIMIIKKEEFNQVLLQFI